MQLISKWFLQVAQRIFNLFSILINLYEYRIFKVTLLLKVAFY